MTEAVLQKLTGVFREVFDDPALVATAAMTAKDVKRWDSLSHIDMIVAVEEAFGVRIATREATSFKNVGDLARMILAKSNKA